jgi:gluconolactonase
LQEIARKGFGMRKTTLIAAFMAIGGIGSIALVLPAAQAPTSVPATGSTRIVDLMTPEGTAEFNAQWRYSDVRIVEAPPVTPGDNAGFAYDIQPHAGEANFDDSAWPVIEPKTLGDRRAGGKVSFGWYRITLTMPSRLGSVDTSGAKAFFSVTIDDYAEVWVNGQLPRGVGKPSPNAIVGFNTPNRVLLAEAVKPGDKIQIAIFGINGPISIAPANRLFMREAKVEFVDGRN